MKASNTLLVGDIFSLEDKLVTYETDEDHLRFMIGLCPFVDIDVYREQVPLKLKLIVVGYSTKAKYTG